jgi:hypothetical protein
LREIPIRDEIDQSIPAAQAGIGWHRQYVPRCQSAATAMKVLPPGGLRPEFHEGFADSRTGFELIRTAETCLSFPW